MYTCLWQKVRVKFTSLFVICASSTTCTDSASTLLFGYLKSLSILERFTFDNIFFFDNPCYLLKCIICDNN